MSRGGESLRAVARVLVFAAVVRAELGEDWRSGSVGDVRRALAVHAKRVEWREAVARSRERVQQRRHQRRSQRRGA